MRLVGLTGSIACGKSTVSKLVRDELPARFACAVIDCDAIAHDIVTPGSWGFKRVVRSLGEYGIVREDGSLDRELLGEIVFRNRDARKKLNKATHLPILMRILREILYLWLQFKFVVVIDMPLLFESGFYHITKPYNVVVNCSPECQVHRLKVRDGMERESAERRISSQMPSEKKVLLGDYVIDNDDVPLDELKSQVRSVFGGIAQQSRMQAMLTSPLGVLVFLLLVGKAIAISYG
jgi:dephospho-CoA kinase